MTPSHPSVSSQSCVHESTSRTVALNRGTPISRVPQETVKALPLSFAQVVELVAAAPHVAEGHGGNEELESAVAVEDKLADEIKPLFDCVDAVGVSEETA